MDAIESMAMVPGGMISARRDVAALVVPARLEDATPQAVADSSDLKKQQLAKDFEAVLLTRLFSEATPALTKTPGQIRSTGCSGPVWRRMWRTKVDSDCGKTFTGISKSWKAPNRRVS